MSPSGISNLSVCTNQQCGTDSPSIAIRSLLMFCAFRRRSGWSASPPSNVKPPAAIADHTEYNSDVLLDTPAETPFKTGSQGETITGRNEGIRLSSEGHGRLIRILNAGHCIDTLQKYVRCEEISKMKSFLSM